MRISDWSSDVCSSDLGGAGSEHRGPGRAGIGREVTIENGGRIDILAIDREGDLSIIQLKRDRTPREVIAQVLEYARWVAGLTTKQGHDIALSKHEKLQAGAFRERLRAPGEGRGPGHTAEHTAGIQAK